MTLRDGARDVPPEERIRCWFATITGWVAEGLAMLLEAQPDVEVVGLSGTVAEVCELAASLRPDVVLMDYALPDGDGMAATAAIKAAQPEVKVVVLTSFVDVDVLVAAIDAGCSGFVTKHKAAGAGSWPTQAAWSRPCRTSPPTRATPCRRPASSTSC